MPELTDTGENVQKWKENKIACPLSDVFASRQVSPISVNSIFSVTFNFFRAVIQEFDRNRIFCP